MEKLSTPSSPWKTYQKIGFGFSLIFFVLYIILLDWSANPIFSYLYYYGPLAGGLDAIISWMGKHLFQIPYVIVSPHDAEHNDRTYVYLLYFTITLFALIGSMIWTLLDRKRQNYELLFYGLTVIIRYYLAFTMFLFALYKFFKLQFPDLDLYTLTEPVGDMSPMHLAWAFLGYSYGYNVFMGLAECAGLLLLFRRTTSLGALLVMAALANVMAINFSFDVHAKMYPTALFVMAAFLLLRDAKRILQFFLTGKAVALPAIKAPEFPEAWMRYVKMGLKIAVIGFFLISHVRDNIAYRAEVDESLEEMSELSGIYELESFLVNGDSLSDKNHLQWKQIIIGDRMLDAVRLEGDSIALASVDVTGKELWISGNQTELYRNMQSIYNEFGLSDNTYEKMDSILVARQFVNSFSFELSDSGILMLSGISQKDSIEINARRIPLEIENFRLMRRGFHWINEASYFY